jgi:hypothetical protein
MWRGTLSAKARPAIAALSLRCMASKAKAQRQSVGKVTKVRPWAGRHSL